MAHEDTPIQIFVNQRYLTPQAQKIVESWRVEPQSVIDKLVEHFRDMGIYRVTPAQEPWLIKDVLHQLRFSPEIVRLVHRARAAELRRQRNRHAA